MQSSAAVAEDARMKTLEASASRHFFSLDAQAYRDFQLHLPFTEHGSRHKVRVGVYSINLSNHGNFHDMYNNEASPFFGSFTGFQRRVDGFILSFGN
jgi:hypothetical protein